MQSSSIALRTFLLNRARTTLKKNITGKTPLVESQEIMAEAMEFRGCFVSLYKQQAIRGCIGCTDPLYPLHEAVQIHTAAAATKDPRFEPVHHDELNDIYICISLLSQPVKTVFENPDALIRKLIPGSDGVILKRGGYKATFLPQVWQELPDPTEFLEHLAIKAGLRNCDWKDAEIRIFTTDTFCEQHK